MLMPTKASRRRPRSPILPGPAGAAWKGGSLVKGSSAQYVHETSISESRMLGSPDEPNFAKIALRAGMEWQRHPRRRVLDRYFSGRGMSLRKLIEITKNGLRHSVDRIGTQTLARHQKIHHSRRFNRLGLAFVGAGGNDRRYICGIANFHHRFFGYGQQ